MKIIRKLEKHIVKEFVELFRLKLPKHFKYLIRIPNEGTIYNCSYRYGLRRGTADFLFSYHSHDLADGAIISKLWIEFKVKGNKQSPEQTRFQADEEKPHLVTVINSFGLERKIHIKSKYILCYSADEAIIQVTDYINGPAELKDECKKSQNATKNISNV